MASLYEYAYPSSLMECPVCIELYSSTVPSRIPRSLFCAHTLCTECCRKCSKKKILICPQCKQETKCETLEAIPKDFTLIALLNVPSVQATNSYDNSSAEDSNADNFETFQNSVLSSFSVSDFVEDTPDTSNKCDNLDRECSETATVFCSSCDLSFCEECAAETHAAKIMQRHKLGPIEKKLSKCPLHQDMYRDLVSTETGEIICLKCHHYGKYQNKPVKSIQEVALIVQAKLEEQMTSMTFMTSSLHAKQNELNHDLDNVGAISTSCREKVETSFRKVEELLAEQKERLLARIDTYEQVQTSFHGQATQTIEIANASLTGTSSHVQQVLEYMRKDDYVTMLLSSTSLHPKLKHQEQLVRQGLDQVRLNTLEFCMDCDAVSEYVSKCAILREIKCTGNRAHSSGAAPTQIQWGQPAQQPDQQRQRQQQQQQQTSQQQRSQQQQQENQQQQQQYNQQPPQRAAPNMQYNQQQQYNQQPPQRAAPNMQYQQQQHQYNQQPPQQAAPNMQYQQQQHQYNQQPPQRAAPNMQYQQQQQQYNQQPAQRAAPNMQYNQQQQYNQQPAQRAAPNMQYQQQQQQYNQQPPQRAAPNMQYNQQQQQQYNQQPAQRAAPNMQYQQQQQQYNQQPAQHNRQQNRQPVAKPMSMSPPKSNVPVEDQIVGGGGGGMPDEENMGRGNKKGAFESEGPPIADPFGQQAIPQEALVQCRTCSRRMTSKALEAHAKACGKGPRKKFDTQKARVAGTEAAQFVLKKGKGAKKGETKEQAAAREAKASKWREQSNAFRNAMQAARKMTEAINSGGPLPDIVPSAPDSSLVPCPHCGRKFNANAAERHIPKCNDIKEKPTILKRGGCTSLERLVAIRQRSQNSPFKREP